MVISRHHVSTPAPGPRPALCLVFDMEILFDLQTSVQSRVVAVLADLLSLDARAEGCVSAQRNGRVLWKGLGGHQEPSIFVRDNRLLRQTDIHDIVH